MSAMSVIFGEECVHLIADAGTYEENGVVTEIASKIVGLPRVNAAFGQRGAVGPYRETLRRYFDKFDTFDALIAAAPETIRRVHRHASAHPDNPPGRFDFEVTFIGWSEATDQAECWSVYTNNDDFGLVWNWPMNVRPGIKSINATFAELNGGVELASEEELFSLPIEDVALALMEEQRRTPHTEGRLQGVLCVGGFVELVTATRKGIARKVLRHWPDRVGEPIRP